MVRFDLPWDLVEEILPRVPATSLTRLRFTCKRWNALSKDEKFITKHMDKAMKQNFVLMLSNFRVYSLRMSLQEIYNNIAFDPSTKFMAQLSPQVEITQVFHCNGLLLCSTKEGNKTKLVVVNPCTGQARWIEPRSHYTKYDKYVLGYENNNNESHDSYKILRVLCGCTTVLEIFELKSNSWRILDNIHYDVDLYMYGRGESLKGNAYWLSYGKSYISSFNFTTETFSYKTLSFPYENFGFNTIALSAVREENLAVLRLSPDTRQMEIWVKNKTDTELVLSFTFDFGFPSDLRFRRYVSFFIEEDKKKLIVVGCGRSEINNKNMVYIVGKHGYRKLDYEQSNDCPPFFFRYVPSLVSLNLPM